MPTTTSRRRRCVRCKQPARTQADSLRFRSTVTKVQLCAHDQLILRDEINDLTRFTGGLCVFCSIPATEDPEIVTFDGCQLPVSVCSRHVFQLENSIYKWSRLGEVVDTGDAFARHRERAAVVRHLKAVEPERLAKPDGVDRLQDQTKLNAVWMAWTWRGHAIERLSERGLTQIDGFDVRDVMSAIAFGRQSEDWAARSARAEGLDLGLDTRTVYTGQRCVVVGDDATKEIITVWGLDKEISQGA